MGQMIYDTFTIGGVGTSAAESTNYSNKMFNGTLNMIQFSTHASTTGTLSTTGAIIVKGEVTGVEFMKFLIASAPLRFFPILGSASSSGALVAGLTTGFAWGEKFPLANERLIVQTSGGSSGSQFCYTAKVIVEGFGTT